MRLIALLLSLAVTPATTADDRAMQLLNDWIAAVQQHTPGESDASLATLGSWSYEDFELMRGYVEALVELPTNDRERVMRRRRLAGDLAAIKDRTKNLVLNGKFDAFKKRAALLHTDAAIRGAAIVVKAPAAVRRTPGGRDQRGVIVKSFDGRVEGFELKNLNWDFARDLLDSLAAAPRRDPFVAQWYRTIGAFFVRERRFADAIEHFDHARTIVPDDPRVMFGEACFNETLAAPRIQNYVKVTTLPNGLIIRDVSSSETHWRRAETLLRRAIAIDPQFAEAKLRLGHILIQQQRHADALTLLEQANRELKDAAQLYYSHLFAGDAQQSLGQAADARASYEFALELYPDSQAARFGLGSSWRAGGDNAKALETILPTLTKDSASRAEDDPWWDYYDGDAIQVDELMARLFAAVGTSPR